MDPLASPGAHVRLRPFIEAELCRECRARGIPFSVLVRAILELHVSEVEGQYLGYRDDDRVVIQLVRPERAEVVVKRSQLWLGERARGASSASTPAAAPAPALRSKG